MFWFRVFSAFCLFVFLVCSWGRGRRGGRRREIFFFLLTSRTAGIRRKHVQFAVVMDCRGLVVNYSRLYSVSFLRKSKLLWLTTMYTAGTRDRDKRLSVKTEHEQASIEHRLHYHLLHYG